MINERFISAHTVYGQVEEEPLAQLLDLDAQRSSGSPFLSGTLSLSHHSHHSALVLFAFQQVAERDHNIISSSAPAGHANILSRHKNCRKRVPRVAAFLSPLPPSTLLFQVNAHRCAACSCYPSRSPLAHVELNSQWPRNELT